ncbi:CCAAT/enhancer-binding protein zeta isoform X2 [Eucyclogobius newberryi]|uniref:CCAAT/enhancer-binding protein zeta isoform X2 n=1 Tax=Eucyclogobius newberryi TaxID=166745 RepID=UPI003B5BBCAB
MAAKLKQKKRVKVSKMNFSGADGADDDPGTGEPSGAEPEDESGDTRDGFDEQEEFNLEEVLKLGGTRADFVQLSTVDEWNELLDGGKKGAIDDLEEGELEKFICKLGIRSYSTLQIVADEAEAGEDEKETKVKKSEKQSEVKQKAKEKKSNKYESEASAAAVERPRASAWKKLKANVFEFTARSALLLRPGGKWFDNDYASESSSSDQDPDLVSKYKTLAQQLLENEVGLYRTKKSVRKGANSSWMKTVVSAGVLADRMAAMTVLIQDSPVHSLEHFENLVSMVKKKGSRRMGLMALDTIRELLLSDLLPANRKLRAFAQRPFDTLEERASGNRDARDRRLVLWSFEHRLKLMVAEFVAALESVSHDTVLATKTKALMTAFELLSGRPEQEKALLTQMVNKLGDPEYKLAAKASYALETLLHRHPNMKGVVCGEVERLLFRANIGEKAQYYALCFLSQVILSRDDADLAARLIGIYFSFFRWCVKRRQVQSKMLSALLSGVNRAYPFAAEGDEAVKSHMDTLFSIVHAVRFNTAVQALMLLFQVMDSQQSVSDRYYGALYRKLLDPGLSSSSRQSMFLNLLYKSVKSDTVLRRVKAFVKRLLQVSAEQSPSFICGALFLLSEVLRSKPALQNLLQTCQDGDEETFKDQPEEEPEEPEEQKEEQEERSVDAPQPQENKPSASWVHHHNMEGGNRSQSYDPLHRNPLFCGADHSSLWELQQLSTHFHPSVSLFAKTILKGDSISYSGDPLQDFTLIRFLDRFVFRNPKQLKGKQNTDSAVLQPKRTRAAASLPVNCVEFVSQDESQIPVDQVFFHRFFRKRRETQKHRPRPEGDTESIEDVDDDEFEKILDVCEGDSGYAQLKDDKLDFAGSVSRQKNKADSEDSDLDQDSDLDLDDEEVELSLDEEDFEEEFEEEGGAFMDPHDEDEEDSEEEKELQPLKRNKRKQLDFSAASGSKAAKKKKKSDSTVFASAEEFGSLLDENSGSKYDSVGLNALRNSDKAGVKQLKWECQRDDWIHDRDAKTLRKKKSTFQRKRKLLARFSTGNRKCITKKRK